VKCIVIAAAKRRAEAGARTLSRRVRCLARCGRCLKSIRIRADENGLQQVTSFPGCPNASPFRRARQRGKRDGYARCTPGRIR